MKSRKEDKSVALSKDYLPIHIATLGLVIIGMLATRKVFESSWIIPVILLITFIGFVESWFHRNNKIPYLKLIVNILALVAVIITFSRFSHFEKGIYGEFIKTLVYIQLFYSFVLFSKRDYHISQAIAAVLLVFSAVFNLERESFYLIYLVIFLLLGIFIMRFSSLTEKKSSSILVASHRRDYSCRAQLGLSIFSFLIVAVFSVPLFFLIPRPHIDISSILPLDFISKQEQGLWRRLQEEAEQVTEKKRNLEKEIAKLDRPSKEFMEETTTRQDPRREWQIEELLPKGMREMNRHSVLLFLQRLILFILFLLPILILFWIAFSLYTRFREKEYFSRLSKDNPNLFIIRLYGLICKLFTAYGCNRLTYMEPKEYLTIIDDKLSIVSVDFNKITNLFLEAKYSAHQFLLSHSTTAIDLYRAITRKLKQSSKGWQSLIIRYRAVNI